MSFWRRLFGWGATPEAMPIGGGPLPIPDAPVVGLGPGPDPAAAVAELVRRTLDTMALQDGVPNTQAARVLLVAISGQEAAWVHRDQVVPGKRPGVLGPATGLWQFERGGGVAGVLRHDRSAAIARRWCAAAGIGGVTPSPDAVWRRLVVDDRLACAFARLLLWTDPRPLPMDLHGGWDCYVRNWRPGKPHPARWPRNWEAAQRVA